MLFTKHLRAVRGLSLRKRVWYKVLNSLERGIINLTIKLVKRIKSLQLADLIAEIIQKLERVLKSCYITHLEAYGYRTMRTVIDAAVRLGCQEALSWASESFALFLTLNNLYNPVGWKH
jgi:hypothetical protein